VRAARAAHRRDEHPSWEGYALPNPPTGWGYGETGFPHTSARPRYPTRPCPAPARERDQGGQSSQENLCASCCCAAASHGRLACNPPRGETTSSSRKGCARPNPSLRVRSRLATPFFLSGSQQLHFISTDFLCTAELRWTARPCSPGREGPFWLWKAENPLHGSCTVKSCLNHSIHVL